MLITDFAREQADKLRAMTSGAGFYPDANRAEIVRIHLW